MTLPRTSCAFAISLSAIASASILKLPSAIACEMRATLAVSISAGAPLMPEISAAAVFDSSTLALLPVPAAIVPVRWTEDGLPLAVQVVAREGQDEMALAVASELEKAFGGWEAP